jgi:raffinose/stachyose/melibiose transport system substrate-binding protein
MRLTALASVVGVSLMALGASSAAAQELKFWTLAFASESATVAFNNMVKDFEAQNPGVTISVETRGVDEQKTALRLAAQAKQGPDIFFSWSGIGQSGEYIKAGLSEPLDRYYEQYGWYDEYEPAALAFAMKDDAGHIHGVPFTVNGEAIYYNKALFEKAGITSEPTTYAELVADNDKLVAAGIAPFTFGGSVNWHMMRLIDVLMEQACGADKHDALLAHKVSWATEPCVTAAFADLKKWSEDYILKPFMGIGQEQSFNLFVAGKAAMMLEGDWLVGQLDQNGVLDGYDVFAFPTDSGRLYGFGQFYYMSAYSEHKDIAAKFLDFLNNRENSQKYLGNAGVLSMNKHVTYSYSRDLENQWLDIFKSHDKIFMNSDLPLSSKDVTEYFRITNSVAEGTMEPSEAGPAFQKFVDEQG